jgi:hypothetical protein
VLDNHLSIGTFFKGCVIFLLNVSEFSRGPDIDPSPQITFQKKINKAEGLGSSGGTSPRLVDS